MHTVTIILTSITASQVLDFCTQLSSRPIRPTFDHTRIAAARLTPLPQKLGHKKPSVNMVGYWHDRKSYANNAQQDGFTNNSHSELLSSAIPTPVPEAPSDKIGEIEKFEKECIVDDIIDGLEDSIQPRPSADAGASTSTSSQEVNRKYQLERTEKEPSNFEDGSMVSDISNLSFTTSQPEDGTPKRTNLIEAGVVRTLLKDAEMNYQNKLHLHAVGEAVLKEQLDHQNVQYKRLRTEKESLEAEKLTLDKDLKELQVNLDKQQAELAALRKRERTMAAEVKRAHETAEQTTENARHAGLRHAQCMKEFQMTIQKLEAESLINVQVTHNLKKEEERNEGLADKVRILEEKLEECTMENNNVEEIETLTQEKLGLLGLLGHPEAVEESRKIGQDEFDVTLDFLLKSYQDAEQRATDTSIRLGKAQEKIRLEIIEYDRELAACQEKLLQKDGTAYGFYQRNNPY